MIRRATFDDMPELSDMIVRGSNELLDRYGQPHQAGAIQEGVAHGLRTGQAVYVDDSRPGLAGFCAWVQVPLLSAGEVAGLGTYVRPELRQRDLGMKLRDATERHCVKLGHRFVTGVAALGNEAARRSCEAAGFRPVAVVYRKDFA